MVKIYNIQSKTIFPEDFQDLVKAAGDNKDIFLLNEDLSYEIIDTEKLTVLKSKRGFFKWF